MQNFKKAKKIWIETEEKLNVYADFIDEFEISDLSKKTELLITADSNYLVYVNGEVIGSLQYHDFPKYKVYDVYDLSEYIRVGKNELLVIGYYQGEDSLQYKLGDAGVMYEVISNDETLCFSSKDTLCRINSAYQCKDVHRYTPQLSFSFIYDSKVDADKYPLVNAIEKDGYDILVPRPISKLVVGERCPAKIYAHGAYYNPDDSAKTLREFSMKSKFVSLSREEMGFDYTVEKFPVENAVEFSTDEGDGIYLVFDLLQENTGFLDLEFEVPGDTRIYISHGEHIKSLRVRNEGRCFVSIYDAHKGVNKFTYRFKRIAGRYVQLQIPVKNVKINYAGILPTQYPLEDKGGLVCKDHLHKKIYEVSKHTLQLCMHEHYEDCPWREQALYGMDSRVAMLSTHYAFKDEEFIKSNLKLLSLSLREDGCLDLCAPATWPVQIPSFTLCFVIAAGEYLQFTKDVEFMEEIYPVLNKIVYSFAAKMTDKGLIEAYRDKEAWNFYEWAPGYDGNPTDVCDFVIERDEDNVVGAPNNAYFSMALKGYAEIAKALGKCDEAKEITAMRNSINEKLGELFWNEEKGLFCSYLKDGKQVNHYGQLTQALMVCCDAAQGDKIDKALEALATENDLIELTMGSYVNKYNALMYRPEKYREFIFEDIAKRWGEMLFDGATSFWEVFDGIEGFLGGGSLCHAWAAVPIYVYYRYGVGLEPDGSVKKYEDLGFSIK